MATNFRHLFWRVRYDTRKALRRHARAFRYAIGRTSHDDALNLLYDAEALSNHYALCSISAESLQEDALDLFEPFPGLERYCEEAVSRVASKWEDGGETTGAALDWALSLVREYAAADGVALVEIGESTGAEVLHALATEG